MQMQVQIMRLLDGMNEKSKIFGKGVDSQATSGSMQASIIGYPVTVTISQRTAA